MYLSNIISQRVRRSDRVRFCPRWKRRCCWAAPASWCYRRPSSPCARRAPWSPVPEHTERTVTGPANLEDNWSRTTDWKHTQTHQAHDTDAEVQEGKGRGWPQQLGSHVGADWLSQDDWQAWGLGGRELGVVKGGKPRCERVSGAQVHLPWWDMTVNGV